MIKFANFWYFFFIVLTAGVIVGLYFLLKNKTMKTKKIVIASMLFFNLALHFLKLLIPPYSTNPQFAIENVWFINICAVSVLTFPFLFLSKSESAKDWMFYIGVISGFLALVYPTEALGQSVLEIDLWRFYICHMIIIIAPLLMVLLGVHKLNYRNIWKMPFYMLAVLLFIICNQVLQSELGIIELRGTELLKDGCGYKNSSQIWGPTDDVSVVFTWLTPSFMKTVPFGPQAGQAKYWPFFYLVPAAFVYFTILPLLLCLPWQFKRIKDDIGNLFAKLKKPKKNDNL